MESEFIKEIPYDCEFCKHYKKLLSCNAFEHISLELFCNPEKHNSIIEGQEGNYIFEPKCERPKMYVQVARR